MTDLEKELLEEGLKFLDDAMSRFMAVENVDFKGKIISGMIHNVFLLAEGWLEQHKAK